MWSPQHPNQPPQSPLPKAVGRRGEWLLLMGLQPLAGSALCRVLHSFISAHIFSMDNLIYGEMLTFSVKRQEM